MCKYSDILAVSTRILYKNNQINQILADGLACEIGDHVALPVHDALALPSVFYQVAAVAGFLFVYYADVALFIGVAFLLFLVHVFHYFLLQLLLINLVINDIPFINDIHTSNHCFSF